MGLNALSANQDHANSLESVEDISKILGNYYDTLKWIQGSAVDLQFQTQELEQKINDTKWLIKILQ